MPGTEGESFLKSFRSFERQTKLVAGGSLCLYDKIKDWYVQRRDEQERSHHSPEDYRKFESDKEEKKTMSNQHLTNSEIVFKTKREDK